MPDTNGQKRVSFFVKEETICPVCGASHHKEEMLTGGGRLIAGKLTSELRRLYQESKKYGLVYPLAYAIQVCPKCYYAANHRDFLKLGPEEATVLKNTADHRIKLLDTLFNGVNFSEHRNLIHGAASMILAVDCYHLRELNIAPTAKKAVCSLRAAWLLDDLFQFAPQRPYDKVRDFYYMEAVRYYQSTLEHMQSGKEPVEAELGSMGPDLDKPWGYDGIIYLNAYLTKKYVKMMTDSNEEARTMLERAKRHLSKLYGTGKSSKMKPSAIVDMAKDLYDDINGLLNEFGAET